MSTAGQFHFVNSVVKGVEDDYNTRILKAVRDVTVDEIKKVMKEVLLPAFTPGVSNVVVTCAPIMEEVSLPVPFSFVPPQCSECCMDIIREILFQNFHSQINSGWETLATSIVLISPSSQVGGFEQQAVFAS